MPPTLMLTLVDGVQVVVPDSLNLITPYVLQEQLDWFENEIRFVRLLLAPGERAIDIGANHGVYALSMAKAVGPAGRVWAFEPASSVGRFLERSIAANRFENVVLDPQAMSDHVGEAPMSVSAASELNTLSMAAVMPGATEIVQLTTLDASMQLHDWRDIDFVKIDAEGEEARILAGGSRFFRELSPLVMYEIRDGVRLHLELVRAFADLGYESYRLVPGLGLLAPFRAADGLDDYALNLFSCKADRAERLASRGLLVRASDSTDTPLSPSADEWRERLSALSYAQRLAGIWDTTMAATQTTTISDALALHARSRDASQAAIVRHGALQESLRLLQAACAQPSGHLRLASLARVAAEFGARATAFRALSQLCDDLRERRNVGPAEPFLAPCERFDRIAPTGGLSNWVLAAALEARERLGAHSSFFTGDASWESLKAIKALGFASDEMLRRLQLIERRFAKPAARA